jgi:peroxiredoxin
MTKIIILAILFFLVLSCAESVDKRIQDVGLMPLKEGTKIVDFELEDLSGNKVKLSSFSGKVVFLNFWATWCPPCREEMPSMQKLHLEFKDKGLEVVAVDIQEDQQTVESFFKEHELTFTGLLDTDGQTAQSYGVRSIPTSYIIDREGNVIAGKVGGRDWFSDEVVGFFDLLLK